VILNPVPPRFIHRGPGLDIGLNFPIRQRPKCNICGLDGGMLTMGPSVRETESRMDRVGGVAQSAEHLTGVSRRFGLAEHGFLMGHHRIRGQDKGVRVFRDDGFCLAPGKGPCHVRWRHVLVYRLVSRTHLYLEVHVDLIQERSTAGRARGQDERTGNGWGEGHAYWS